MSMLSSGGTLKATSHVTTGPLNARPAQGRISTVAVPVIRINLARMTLQTLKGLFVGMLYFKWHRV